VDFAGTVRPGDRVTTTGRMKFWRRKKLRASFEMTLDDGTVVCSGELSGMGVPR
jgi:acyl-CoA thioesterase FadM